MVAALDFEKSWAELTDRQRQLVQERLPLLAALTRLPPSTNTAIVDNAATAIQGTWQYTCDGEATWVDVPTGLSASNALVLPVPVRLRFNSMPDFRGTPGDLAAHVYYGGTALPVIVGCDISQSVGVTGQWTAGRMIVGVDGNGKIVETSVSWDFLRTGAEDLVQLRYAQAAAWDYGHDPKFADEREAAFAAEAERHEKARQLVDLDWRITRLKGLPATVPSEELAKMTALKQLEQERSQLIAGGVSKPPTPVGPVGASRRGGHTQIDDTTHVERYRRRLADEPSLTVRAYVLAHDREIPGANIDAKVRRLQIKVSRTG